MSYFEYVFGFFAAKAKTDVKLSTRASVRRMASSFLVFFMKTLLTNTQIH